MFRQKNQKTVNSVLLLISFLLSGAHAEVITEVSSVEGGYYNAIDSKTFQNVDLAYLTGIKATVSSSFGQLATKTYTVSGICEPTAGVTGIYYWANDGKTASGQIQWKGDYDYTYCLIVELTQSGVDVVAKLVRYRYNGNRDIGTDHSGSSNSGGLMTESYLGNDTGDTEFALVDLQLLVSDERQLAVDDEWDGAGSGVAAGDTLIWNGGADGTWDTATENWLTTNSVATRWVKGCVAKFVGSAAIAMTGGSGKKTVAGFELSGDKTTVELSGDELVMVEPASVLYNDNAELVLNGTVSGEAGFVQKHREVNDVFHPEVPVNSELGDQDFTATEDVLLFSNMTLSDIKMLRGTICGKFGNYAEVSHTVNSLENSNENAGVYYYENNGAVLTAQFQVKSDGSYGGVYHCIKIQLTQNGADIYGKMLYIRSGTRAHHYKQEGWGLGSDWDVCENQKNNYVTRLHSLQIVTPAYTDYDTMPTNTVTSIAGNYSATGDLIVSNGVVRIVEGGLMSSGLFAQPVIVTDGVLDFAGSSAQTISSKITTDGDGYVLVSGEGDIVFNSNVGSDWDFRVSGVARATKYSTLPTGGAGLTVLPGGLVGLSDFNSFWGPNAPTGPIRVMTNGVVRLDSSMCMGCSKPYYLEGGTITNAVSAEQLVYKLYMNDGASFVGKGAMVGFTSYYNSWSFINVGGSLPSSFSAESLVIGYQYPAAENKPVGVKFIVSNVTEDEETDFTMNSPILDREGVVLFSEGYRANCGIWKTGAGTLELTAAGSCATSGVFRIDAGAVRLAAGSSGAYGALILEGNAAIDCAGGSISFDDSAEFAWAEGAVLDITGDLRRKQIRFGTSPNGLTAAQLSSLAYNGKVGALLIDEDGYLAVKRGFNVRIR